MPFPRKLLSHQSADPGFLHRACAADWDPLRSLPSAATFTAQRFAGYPEQRPDRRAGTSASKRMLNILIGGQIALTFVLLGSAGAAIAGFLKITSTSSDTIRTTSCAVDIPLKPDTRKNQVERAAYIDQLRERVAAVPGVLSVAVTSSANLPSPPFAGMGTQAPFEILGGQSQQEPHAVISLVGSEYFATLKIPILKGRVWNHAENQRGDFVAVINQTLAQSLLAQGRCDRPSNPRSASLKDDGTPLSAASPQSGEWRQIIGVVADSKTMAWISPPLQPSSFLTQHSCGITRTVHPHSKFTARIAQGRTHRFAFRRRGTADGDRRSTTSKRASGPTNMDAATTLLHPLLFLCFPRSRPRVSRARQHGCVCHHATHERTRHSHGARCATITHRVDRRQGYAGDGGRWNRRRPSAESLSGKGDSALEPWKRLCSVGLRRGDAPASHLRHHRLPSARQAGGKCKPYKDTPLRLALDTSLSTRPAQSLKRTLLG